MNFLRIFEGKPDDDDSNTDLQRQSGDSAIGTIVSSFEEPPTIHGLIVLNGEDVRVRAQASLAKMDKTLPPLLSSINTDIDGGMPLLSLDGSGHIITTGILSDTEQQNAIFTTIRRCSKGRLHVIFN